jgi:hypothetical protein
MNKIIFLVLCFLPTILATQAGELSYSKETLNHYCAVASDNRKISQLSIHNHNSFGNVCRYDTPWIDQMYHTLCNQYKAKTDGFTTEKINAIPAPKNILFFFDGAGDYNASLAHRTIAPINIDGTEGVDVGLGNANGLEALINMMNSDRHALSKNKDKIELHYHSGSGLKGPTGFLSAIACAKETKYYLDILNLVREEKIQTKWMVMGYSNGGQLTVDFQNTVPNFGINIDLAFSIDPIEQIIFYPTHKLSETVGTRNSKTKRFVNFYQNTDKDSLPGFELRGKPVKDADVNMLLTPESTRELMSDGSYNHLRIISSYRIFDESNNEFKKILND